MNIGIDMMGGDFAPLEAVKGVELYFSENNQVSLFLIGNKTQLEQLISAHKIPADKIRIIHADQVIGMHEPGGADPRWDGIRH